MQILLFSGSLRVDSFNKKLLNNVTQLLKNYPECTTVVADLKALNIPVYDGDIESVGIPDGVQALGKMITDSDALIVCSPEYNGSIAGSLKNTIDWVSRLRPIPFDKLPVLLTGASPGGFGTVKALTVTRTPFETLGSFVYPQSFALSRAHEAFDKEGILIDQGNTKRLSDLLTNYIEFAKKF